MARLALLIVALMVTTAATQFPTWDVPQDATSKHSVKVRVTFPQPCPGFPSVGFRVRACSGVTCDLPAPTDTVATDFVEISDQAFEATLTSTVEGEFVMGFNDEPCSSISGLADERSERITFDFTPPSVSVMRQSPTNAAVQYSGTPVSVTFTAKSSEQLICNYASRPELFVVSGAETTSVTYIAPTTTPAVFTYIVNAKITASVTQSITLASIGCGDYAGNLASISSQESYSYLVPPILSLARLQPTVERTSPTDVSVTWVLTSSVPCTSGTQTPAFLSISDGSTPSVTTTGGQIRITAAILRDGVDHQMALTVRPGFCTNSGLNNFQQTFTDAAYAVDNTPPTATVALPSAANRLILPFTTSVSWSLKFADACAVFDPSAITVSAGEVTSVTQDSAPNTFVVTAKTPVDTGVDYLMFLTVQPGACYDSSDLPNPLLTATGAAFIRDATQPQIIAAQQSGSQLRLSPSWETISPGSGSSVYPVKLRFNFTEDCTLSNAATELKDGLYTISSSGCAQATTNTITCTYDLPIGMGSRNYSAVLPVGFCLDASQNPSIEFGPARVYEYVEANAEVSFVLKTDTSGGGFRTTTLKNTWSLVWVDDCYNFDLTKVSVPTVPAGLATILKVNQYSNSNRTIMLKLDATAHKGQEITFRVVLNPGACRDFNGNLLLTTHASASGVYDPVPPTATFSSTDISVTSVPTYSITINFSEECRIGNGSVIQKAFWFLGAHPGAVLQITSASSRVWKGILTFTTVDTLVQFFDVYHDVHIPKGAFRDIAGNLNAEIAQVRKTYMPPPALLSSYPGYLQGSVDVKKPFQLIFNVPIAADIISTRFNIEVIEDGVVLDMTSDWNIDKRTTVTGANDNILQIYPFGTMEWKASSTYQVRIKDNAFVTNAAGVAGTTLSTYAVTFRTTDADCGTPGCADTTTKFIALRLDVRFYTPSTFCKAMQQHQRSYFGAVFPTPLSCEQITASQIGGSIGIQFKVTRLMGTAAMKTVENYLDTLTDPSFNEALSFFNGGTVGLGTYIVINPDASILTLPSLVNTPNNVNQGTSVTLTLATTDMISLNEQTRALIRFPETCTHYPVVCDDRTSWRAVAAEVQAWVTLVRPQPPKYKEVVPPLRYPLDMTGVKVTYNHDWKELSVEWLKQSDTLPTMMWNDTLEIQLVSGLYMPASCDGLNQWTWLVQLVEAANDVQVAWGYSNPPNDKCKGLAALIFGDPHFRSFSGGEYDVTGKVGYTYNIISDKYFQWNAKFVSLSSRATMYSYFGLTGFIVNGTKVQYDPTNDEATVDGKVLKDESERHAVGDQSGKYFVKKSAGMLMLRVPGFRIALKRVMKDHGKKLPHFDQVVDFVKEDEDVVHPHGLLGQTARFTKPVKATDKHGGGVIEGQLEDYEVSTIFGTQFKFNQYDV